MYQLITKGEDIMENIIRRTLERTEFLEINGKHYKVEYLRREKENTSWVDVVCISTEYKAKYFEIDKDTDIVEFIKRNEKSLL